MQVILMPLLFAAQATNSGVPSPPISSPGYNEQRIGEWVLRSDPKARTFGVVWADSGVIELAARSADGRVEWVIRDNGAILSDSLSTPSCGWGSPQRGYPGAKGISNVAHLVAGVLGSDGCRLGAYKPQVLAWARDFPAAIEAMKMRAKSMYGADLNRCIVPGTPRVPTPHPACGFPPPAIGENHAQSG
jgi:hypothetical protein